MLEIFCAIKESLFKAVGCCTSFIVRGRTLKGVDRAPTTVTPNVPLRSSNDFMEPLFVQPLYHEHYLKASKNVT